MDIELFHRITNVIGYPEKTKGNEYSFRRCPFCGSEGKSDDFTFSINKQTGQYRCFRLNHCGAKGNLITLAKHLNIDYKTQEQYSSFKYIDPIVKKDYKKPEAITSEPSQAIYDYFENRGISRYVVDSCGIKMTSNGWISYEYIDDTGILSFRKFRKIEKKVIRREKETKPILYLMNLVSPDNYDSIIITEGEEDCLSLHESNWTNAVSLPSGASDFTFLEYSYDYLDRFKNVILWMDNDSAGAKAVEDFIKKVGVSKVKIVKYKDYKDANEVLLAEGNKGIYEAIMSAKYTEIVCVVNGSEIDILNKKEVEKCKSSIYDINKFTFGGYRIGDVICWTGFTSSGKTTFLTQEVANFVCQGKKVMIYSAEASNSNLMQSIYTQLHNRNDLHQSYDEYGNKIYALNKEVCSKIKNKIKDNVYIIKDDFNGNTEDLIKIFETINIRYGVNIFVVDNIMTLLEHNKEIYEKQTEAFKQFSIFAKSRMCMVNIVAHQKKPLSTETKPSKYGVSGTSNIPNLVDMQIGIEKLYEQDKQSRIIMLKDRNTGLEGVMAELFFTYPNKRFLVNFNEDKAIEWSKL